MVNRNEYHSSKMNDGYKIIIVMRVHTFIYEWRRIDEKKRTHLSIKKYGDSSNNKWMLFLLIHSNMNNRWL